MTIDMNQKLETINTLIYRSTDESLKQENWGYIIDVCDYLNQNGDIKTTISVLQKRFMCKNTNIQLYSLSLTEALAKNCGSSVYHELLSQTFIETLLKLFEDTCTHIIVKERILSLIEQWMIDFASSPFSQFLKQVYDQFKIQHKYIEKVSKNDELMKKEERELQLALALSLERNKKEYDDFKTDSKYDEKTSSLVTKSSPFSSDILKVKALYDFQATELSELSFRKGNIITVLDTTYKDWWRGSLNGMEGIFPINYVEKLPEPAPDELRKEMEDEIKILSCEENIEKLLKILSNVDLTENNNIIESDQFQDLYHSTLTIRSKLVKLIKKYVQKKDDIISLNERFTRAIKDYEILMEKSMSHFSHASLHNPFTEQYYTSKYDDFQKLSQSKNDIYKNENINNSTESYYLNALCDQSIHKSSLKNTKELT
ncbi:hypothetical protein PCANB_000668 [Pneumocystis canis]|nr:hypothetical protein PCANB_000668 [Pneumocystis canis]